MGPVGMVGVKRIEVEQYFVSLHVMECRRKIIDKVEKVIVRRLFEELRMVRLTLTSSYACWCSGKSFRASIIFIKLNSHCCSIEI